MTAKCLLIIAALLVVVFAILSLSTSDCPDVALQADFDPLRYAGLWYEHARDSSIKFEKGDC